MMKEVLDCVEGCATQVDEYYTEEEGTVGWGLEGVTGVRRGSQPMSYISRY